VVRLPDLRTMRVKAMLSDVDEGRVAPGMTAICTLDAHPERKMAGVVRSISPVAREPAQRSQRRSFEVIVSISESDRSQMLPGLSVKVEIQGRQVAGALVAPRAAIDFDAEPARLLLAGGGTVPIDVGLCDAQRCQVRGRAGSPLAAGQRLRVGERS